jgi:hypothetical protein
VVDISSPLRTPLNYSGAGGRGQERDYNLVVEETMTIHRSHSHPSDMTLQHQISTISASTDSDGGEEGGEGGFRLSRGCRPSRIASIASGTTQGGVVQETRRETLREILSAHPEDTSGDRDSIIRWPTAQQQQEEKMNEFRALRKVFHYH